MLLVSPIESASDIAGSKITEREFVIVEGKLIKDIAIPVSMPYFFVVM